MSGLNLDGTKLFNTAFAIGSPYIAYNTLRTSSEQNQQNGLIVVFSVLRGLTFGTV